jgi:hypothetical protein
MQSRTYPKEKQQSKIQPLKVMGELKDVLIMLSLNPKVHQIIDIIVVDIL